MVKRWKEHRHDKRSCFGLHRAIVKYGKENFTVEQIDVACDREELDKKEIYWIKYYDCLSPKGYNLHTGGIHHEVSDETRERIRNSQKGEKHWLYGKHQSNEVKRKISEAKKGKYRGSESPNAKKVKCIETNEVFGCLTSACEKHNIATSTLCGCVRGHRKTAAGLHWRYVND